MLILTRRVGETLMIGDSVSVTALDALIDLFAMHSDVLRRGDEAGGTGSENSAE
jgi:carbon storage regulator